MGSVYKQLIEAKKNNKTLLGALVDPEKYSAKNFERLANLVNYHADFLLIGGSLTTNSQTDKIFAAAKKLCKKPVIVFPGPGMTINKNADGILLLSLISGRNPDFLIGRHVENAFNIESSNLEIIPTGYILIDNGGNPSSVAYMSQTQGIPADKTSIITATALAGQQLGLRCIYLEAGSGANSPISPKSVTEISNIISIPLIVGGGIRNGQQAMALAKAGANLLVVGNILEKKPEYLTSIKKALPK